MESLTNGQFSAIINVTVLTCLIFSIVAIAKMARNVKLGSVSMRSEIHRILILLHLVAFTIFNLLYRNLVAGGAPSRVVALWGSIIFLHIAGNLLGYQIGVARSRVKKKSDTR